jgi:hypothetical protein
VTTVSPNLRLDVPTDAPRGATVPITLLVENPSEQPLDLYLRGRDIAFDVVVARANGDVAWRRLEGEIIPAILQLRTLAPHEVLELRAQWDQRTNRGRPVDAGLYSVRGVLLTEEQVPLETPIAQLRISAE